jgi:hypothetical protein
LVVWFVALHLRHSKKWGDHIYVNPQLRYFEVVNKLDIRDQLIDMWRTTLRRDINKLWTSIKFTLNRGLFISQSRVGLPDLFELLTLLVIPSTYIIIKSWCISLNDISISYGNYLLSFEKEKIDPFEIVDHLESTSIIDINNMDKKSVKQTLDNIYKLNKIINSDINEIFDMWRLYK